MSTGPTLPREDAQRTLAVVNCQSGFGVVRVAVALPCGDFVGEDLLVSDAAIQTLRRENAEFGFGQVEPTAVLGGVMPIEAARGARPQLSGLFARAMRRQRVIGVATSSPALVWAGEAPRPTPCQPHPKNCIAHPKNCAASIPNGLFTCSSFDLSHQPTVRGL